jgi:hypothetical protein
VGGFLLDRTSPKAIIKKNRKSEVELIMDGLDGSGRGRNNVDAPQPNWPTKDPTARPQGSGPSGSRYLQVNLMEGLPRPLSTRLFLYS